MKIVFNLLCALMLILVSVPVFADEQCAGITYKKNKLCPEKVRVSPCGLRTTYIPRSQGSNMARWLAGWKEYLPGCDGRAWGNFSLALEYSRSFRGDRIAQYLFGSTQLTFSGSQVVDRGERDLLADYFGLPTNFVGAISFRPRIDNIILDINYQLGLDEWCYGLYFMCNAPIVVTRWDLGIRCNEVNNISSQQAPVFPACYMAKKAVPTELSIRGALSGGASFGDLEQNLMYGAFPCGRMQKTAVSNIDLILGYNFLMNESAHAGIFLLTLVPTGNVPHAKIIFEPLVGNGRLWELGPGIYAHFDLFRHNYHSLGIWIEGVLTHQFKVFQARSFDLVGHGPLSRYMLLKEFDKNDHYEDSLFNAIDFTTRATEVGGSVRLDAAVKLSYYYDRWGCDLGYNIYARTKEKLRIEDSLHPSDLNNRHFGIKGTEGVCYRIINTKTGVIQDRMPILNSTQNRATIHAGAPIDNPAPIELENPNNVAITWDSPTTPPFKIAMQSNPPIIIPTAQMDIEDYLDITSGAVPHQLTHKVFAHISYTALDKCWEPQFGIGGEAEFDGRSDILSGLNQWGIWFKWAFSY